MSTDAPWGPPDLAAPADGPPEHERTADRDMSTVKKWIAAAATLVVVIVVLALLGVISLTVRQTGNGSNPDDAFSPTAVVPEALAAPLTWLDDADDLVRVVEPATREQLTATWLRGNDALVRAADGDPTGLDVWFTDAALDAATSRFGGAHATATGHAVAHELRVDFYSLDGQIVVLTAQSEVRRGTDEHVERFESILVLADGNWRIRNLERVDQR